MIIAGLDFETTGTSMEADRIIEIGCVLWDTVLGQPVEIYSALVLHPDGPEVTAEITLINGLTQALLQARGRAPCDAFADLAWYLAQADAVCAHNGTTFDRPMFEAERGRQASAGHGHEWKDIPWIDTMVDIDFPPRLTARKLSHLAAEHGFLNPFPHRAVFDVMTMLQGYRWDRDSRQWRKTLKKHRLAQERAACAADKFAIEEVLP